MKRFRGGLVFKDHRLCVSLNSGLESNKDEEKSIRLGLIIEWNNPRRTLRGEQMAADASYQ